ncbi:hypothetical protein [Fluviispira vulneris]|uniref:hypothetical protein n=1 Tax=Fluviispira vulneris TaxID=2763012 RepID=UPI001646802C|nr:hypothetical protein [Fluviispira vulneris]
MKLSHFLISILATTAFFPQNNSIATAAFFPQNNSTAAEAYIYCSNDNNDWEWLNNRNITVPGKWRFYPMNITNSFVVFILTGGENAYIYLAEKCAEEFGNRYPYPQPASSIFNNWFVFATQNGKIFPGYKTLY